MQDARSLTRPFDGTSIPAAGAYELDPPHTFVMFAVQHLVVGRVRGRFNSASGRIVIADDPAHSSVEVQIDTASVDTQNAMRDGDLRGERFLNVAKYPLMTFAGHGVTPDLDARWTLDGSLTVRDVTLPVPLSGRFLGVIVDPSGTTRAAFHATAAISRKDFGLVAELERESGGILLGKDILIEISAEATLPATEGDDRTERSAS